MLLLLLLASADCAECHRDIVAKQAASRHARSLRPFAGSRLETALRAGPLGERAGFEFAYGPGTVTAKREEERAEGTLEWAFGAGAFAMTAVGRREGRYFEFRLSHYTAPDRVGLTPGHPRGASATAVDALGLVQPPEQALRCFGCHSTGLKALPDGQPDVATMIAGVQCERCHGPGTRHSEAARAGRPAAEVRRAIFNSGRMPAKASVEVCGGCHRIPLPGDRSLLPEVDDPVSVRFQPFGLMASRCFRVSGRLSCVGCHDPHEDAVRPAGAHYTAKCLSCHANVRARIVNCGRARREDCVPCHMPKTTPLPYLTFTDHRIRVE